MKNSLMIIPLIILLCLTFSCKQKVEEGITEEEANLLMDNYMAVVNEANLALADEIIAPEFELRSPILPEPIVGIESFKAFITNTAATFTDFQCTIKEVVVKGDDIWSRFTISGINTGPLPDGTPATSKKFQVTGLAITRVVNGKVVRDETFWNVLDMMHQLGFMLAPPQPPEAAEEKR
jgi:predicted ester cyclase